MQDNDTRQDAQPLTFVEYEPHRFTAASLAIIEQANAIISNYQAQGYDLTLRQLYYQFVSRALIENTDKSYKRIGGILSKARLAGLVSWAAIVDRTRHVRSPVTWDGPGDIVRACAQQFKIDLWATQDYRPEVWIEKDALIGVIEPVCRRLRVSCFSCRGYASQSALWSAGCRLSEDERAPVIFHLGDHDPSGLDMTRDIRARVSMFAGCAVKVIRLALNADQIEEYKPPPNPAKLTDSRGAAYVSEHGGSSWELDALDPATIEALITDAINPLIDRDDWAHRLDYEAGARERLREMAEACS